jgi:hypothetical protein
MSAALKVGILSNVRVLGDRPVAITNDDRFHKVDAGMAPIRKRLEARAKRIEELKKMQRESAKASQR